MNELRIDQHVDNTSRWGGISGIAGSLLMIVTFGFVVAFVGMDITPSESLTRFADIRTARTVENTLYLGIVLLWVVHSLALYRVLRRTSPTPALFGTTLSVLGLVLLAAGACPTSRPRHCSISTTPPQRHRRTRQLWCSFGRASRPCSTRCSTPGSPSSTSRCSCWYGDAPHAAIWATSGQGNHRRRCGGTRCCCSRVRRSPRRGCRRCAPPGRAPPLSGPQYPPAGRRFTPEPARLGVTEGWSPNTGSSAERCPRTLGSASGPNYPRPPGCRVFCQAQGWAICW